MNELLSAVMPNGKANDVAELFIADPFESNAVLGFDFDGSLALLVSDPSQARPHPESIVEIRRFLSQSPERMFRVISGRPTRFFAEIQEFRDLLNDFPQQVEFHGYYGSQMWSAVHDHVLPAELFPYADVIQNFLHDRRFEPLLEPLVNEWSADLQAIGMKATANLLSSLGVHNMVFENKQFIVTLHSRRLIDELGLLPAFEKLRRGEQLAEQEQAQAILAQKIETDVQKLASACVESLSQTQYPFRIKPGSMISEIVPESFEFDKSLRFEAIVDECADGNMPRPVYYFGDDKGDYTIFQRIAQMPNATSIFVDSSPLDMSSELVDSRKIADIHIQQNPNGPSAVEQCAELLKAKGTRKILVISLDGIIMPYERRRDITNYDHDQIQAIKDLLISDRNAQVVICTGRDIVDVRERMEPIITGLRHMKDRVFFLAEHGMVMESARASFKRFDMGEHYNFINDPRDAIPVLNVDGVINAFVEKISGDIYEFNGLGFTPEDLKKHIVEIKENGFAFHVRFMADVAESRLLARFHEKSTQDIADFQTEMERVAERVRQVRTYLVRECEQVADVLTGRINEYHEVYDTPSVPICEVIVGEQVIEVAPADRHIRGAANVHDCFSPKCVDNEVSIFVVPASEETYMHEIFKALDRSTVVTVDSVDQAMGVTTTPAPTTLIAR